MENKKEEAAGRISFFLETWFTSMRALEIGFCLAKDNKIVIQDSQTGLSTTFTPEQFQKTYEKWAKENKVDD